MSLGFANPLLLWGLLAAAIPLVIHLFFRRRPKPTPFPAIDFILRARKETERRLRLKKLLLFAARTLLLAAAALAITRPRAERPEAAAAGAAQGPLATVIVLDASGSMRYRLGGEPLFERARGEALSALAGLAGEEPVAALVCDGRPPSAPAPAFDRVAVRRVLSEASAAAGHADLTACVAAAARALAEAKAQEKLGKRIVVVTDLTAAAWRLDVPPPEVPGPTGPTRPQVAVVDAARGAALPNTAVTALAAEPDPAVGPRGYRLTATVASSSMSPQKDLPVALRVGAGSAVDARPAIRTFVDLPAGGAARKTLSYAFPQGGPATASFSLPGDALPLDDERVLTVTVPREIRALVVDGAPSPVKYRDEAYFVESALGSPASPVRPALIDAEALREADFSKYDVVFLLNVRSVGARAGDLGRFVEEGGGLFLSMGDQIDPDLYDRELGRLLPLQLHVVKTAVERGAAGGAAGAAGGGAPAPMQGTARAARLARIDEAHPALSVFTGEAREGLLGARFERYMLTRPAAKGETPAVLAAYDDGAPALVEARRGRGRVLLFTSTVDRDWSDWAIRTSFLPAVQRFAAWLSGGLEERRDLPTVVGSPRTVALGEGRALVALIGPDGKALPRRDLEARGLEASDGGATVTWTPPEPGLWQVKVAERGAERVEPSLAFAVVADPRESDTRRLEPGELTAWLGGEAHARVEGQGSAAAGSRAVPLWSVLLAAAVVLFLAEGLLLG